MELSRSVAIQLGIVLHDNVIVDRIDGGRLIVPVMLIAFQRDDRSRHPGIQPVGTIRYQLPRPGERVAMLGYGARVHRKRARMRKQAQHVRRRA